MNYKDNPEKTNKELKRIQNYLKKKGLKHVTGAMIVEDSVRTTTHFMWSSAGNDTETNVKGSHNLGLRFLFWLHGRRSYHGRIFQGNLMIGKNAKIFITSDTGELVAERVFKGLTSQNGPKQNNTITGFLWWNL